MREWEGRELLTPSFLFFSFLLYFFYRPFIFSFSVNPFMATFTTFASLFLLLTSFLITSSYAQELLACLTSHGLQNFTTATHSSYSHRLDKSLQNLRFLRSVSHKPFVVIYPVNKHQVGTAVRCAREGSWNIRLRGGGHSFEGLSSSYAETPFVLIDLVNLNRIKVDVESETAWVEGGTTLGEIYHAVTKASNVHGFSGGMCVTVGSGGHISGGGYGALARKYGLAADNVVDAILVDARGRTLDRKSMGEEVFWALRGGGGGNYGVVVAWKIRILRVPETVTAFRAVRMGSPSEMAELWYKWQLAAPNLEEEFFLQVAVFPGVSFSVPVIMGFLGMYLGPKSSALSAITSAFPELGITDEECKRMNWADAFILLRGDPQVNMFEQLPDRFSYEKMFVKSKADFVKDPIPKAALEGALELLADQTVPAGWLLLDPYGGALGRIESDATPFAHRAGNIYAIEYFIEWHEKDDGGRDGYMNWIRNIYAYMTPHVAKNPRTVYVNNVDLDLGVMDWTNFTLWGGKAVEAARSWGEKYFLGNYDRLVRAKTLIDPDNVFRHPQSIPPMPPSKEIGLIMEEQGVREDGEKFF